MSELHVITTISNPIRYRSRFKLFEEFRKRIESDGAILYIVELAFDDAPFVVTDRNNSRHFQIRSRHLLWYKENLINFAFKRLPFDWKYAAWIDADIAFVGSNWIAETLEKLHRHAFVQMFSHAIDLGPNCEPLKISQGFAYQYLQEHRVSTLEPIGNLPGRQTRHYGQPGYAWAARRDAIEAVGGLIDWSILGANDYYMALAFVGEINLQSGSEPLTNYTQMFLRWQDLFQKRVGPDFGYVKNSLLHYWHGSRRDRGYTTRGKLLKDHEFDPDVDLRRSAQGLLELTDEKPGLRSAIRQYFVARDEDSNDINPAALSD